MDTHHQVRLLLRFYKDVDQNIDDVLRKFTNYTNYNTEDYNLRIHENHMWIYIIGSKKRYWSPHLHLQFESKPNNATHIRGLFGPDQTLWTLFMFLHFIVAGFFTIFGTIAYSNYTLNQPIKVDLIIMFLMVIVWFLLYVIARQIRNNGNGQMNELEQLFLKIVNS